MNNLVSSYFGQSIKRLVMASFVFVLLLPIGFFVYSLFQNSWKQVEQRMVEKHHLISEALVEPFTLFISSRQQALNTLGQEIIELNTKQLSPFTLPNIHALSQEQNVQRILDKHLNSFGNFVALSYTSDPESDSLECIAQNGIKHNANKISYASIPVSELPSWSATVPSKDFISPIFQSRLSGKPVLLIKHPIFDRNELTKGMIYAEVSLDQIDAMCSRINFGVKGHCAVVDNTGRVVSHPNKDWVKTIRDLSKISITKKMLAGESGTTEFYSPFLKADMVAGYSPIPALGWGVMIPQPKAELTQSLDDIRLNTLIWMLFGVAIALLVSFILTRKITSPINRLIKLTRHSEKDSKHVNIGSAPESSPSEIKQLWDSFARLLSGLQRSNIEVKRLNISLQKDIQIATAELQEVNKNLQITNSQDYLTSLSNRRHFSQHLSEVLNNKIGENIGIIMIDVDKFKHLNDHYGHEAGDLALIHLSDIMKRAIRPCDLVARLGGDEFIIYIQDPTDESLMECGEKIRESIELNPLQLDGDSIPITLSIGTVNQRNTGQLSKEALLRFADSAMYVSKTLGRNQVSQHDTGEVA